MKKKQLRITATHRMNKKYYPLRFYKDLQKWLRIYKQNFTRLFCVSIYAKLHKFIRSSPRQCPNRLTEVGCVRLSIRTYFQNPSIHPSTKFFRFGYNLVCGTRYAHACNLYPIQGQGQRQGHDASEVKKIALY